MMINQRFCEIQGHEANPIILICTLTGCKKYSRWMCLECNDQSIHDHQQSNFDHIQDIDQFKTYFINNAQKLFEEKVNKIDLIYIHYLEKIEAQIQSCKNQILSKNHYNQYLDQAFRMIDADIFSIDKEQLNCIIEFKLGMTRDYLQFQNTLRFAEVQIQNMISRIDAIIYEHIGDKQMVFAHKLLNIQAQMDQFNCQKKYNQICKLQVQNDSFAAKISPNEKYLMFCNQNNKIQLNNIKKCQKVGILSSSLKIELAEFSKNSQSIILCTNKGKIKVFDIKNLKLQFYKKLINSQFINLLLISDQQIITRQQDKSIITTNFGNRKSIQNIQFDQNKQIKGFDIDKEQQMMVFGYEDQIHIHNIQGQLLFTFNFSHRCRMDQLSVLQKDRLLITENGLLSLLQLDFEQNQIQVLKSCKMVQKYFSLACNNSRVILIEKFQIVILDNNLNKIQEVPHQNINVYFVYKQFQQIESLNYLFVQGEQTLDLIQLYDR